MSSGSLPSCKRTVLESKNACLHSNAKSDFASEGRAEGRMLRMLECQSRQVPMKSKRTALIPPSDVVRNLDIIM